MKGFIIGNILLSLAGVGTAALLVMSVAPIAFGGLDVTMDEDLKFNFDGETFTVEAGITIKSNMPWDINLAYELTLGPPGNPIMYDSDSTLIKSGGEGKLKLKIEANAGKLLVYFMDCVESSLQINDDGTFTGHVSLPLNVNLTGDYIGSQFDVNVGFDLGGSAEGLFEIDDDGTSLEGNIRFESEVDFPVSVDMGFEIIHETGGSVKGSLKYLNKDLELKVWSVDGLTSIADILEKVYEDGGTLKVDGKTIAMDKEMLDMLINSISGMLESAGAV